jgi:hypothetical protein
VAFFELMLLLGAASLPWCIRKRCWSGAISIVLWAHLALFSARSIPVFVFLAAPWIGCMLSDIGSQSKDSLFGQAICKLREMGSEFQHVERIKRLHLFSAVIVLLVVANLGSKRPGFETTFDPNRFPQSALTLIDRMHARRIFATDQWSDYFLYERWPVIRVFVDGRSDFYGTRMTDRALHIFNARWNWESDLSKSSADMVVVTPTIPLAAVLKGSPGWKLVLDDKSVLVFARSGIFGQPSRLDE